MKTYDVALIGAGVFGAWTALQLVRRGKRVVLLEAYGPGHSRSSSGDESRIIRMGYGKDEIYTRWSQRSLAQWKELFAATRDEPLFHQTGVLWLAGEDQTRLNETRATLKQCDVAFEDLDLVSRSQERAMRDNRRRRLGVRDLGVCIKWTITGVERWAQGVGAGGAVIIPSSCLCWT